MTVDARRADIISAIQAETGIDDQMIQTLVHGFYGRVRQDPLLAPIFTAHVADWEIHLKTMCEFWSSVALMSGRYHGRPMAKHSPLEIDARHFDRWLHLFEESAADLCPPVAATHFIERARRIAESLELGVAAAGGLILPKGSRLHRPELDPSMRDGAGTSL